TVQPGTPRSLRGSNSGFRQVVMTAGADSLSSGAKVESVKERRPSPHAIRMPQNELRPNPIGLKCGEPGTGALVFSGRRAVAIKKTPPQTAGPGAKKPAKPAGRVASRHATAPDKKAIRPSTQTKSAPKKPSPKPAGGDRPAAPPPVPNAMG